MTQSQPQLSLNRKNSNLINTKKLNPTQWTTKIEVIKLGLSQRNTT